MNIKNLGNGLIAVSNLGKFAVKHINEENLEVTDIPVFNSKDIVVPGNECSPAIYATEYQDKVLCYYQEDGFSWEVRVFAKLMCKNFYQAIFMDFEGKIWKTEYYQDDPYLHELFVRVVPVQ